MKPEEMTEPPLQTLREGVVMAACAVALWLIHTLPGLRRWANG